MKSTDSYFLIQSQSLTDYDYLHENTTQNYQVHASIIIPVYNQEKNIPYLLEKIKEALAATIQTCEVIVINDGSYDNTLSVLINQHKLNPHLRVFSYAENRGKGFAVKTGVMKSKGSIILFIDGDLNVSPDTIRDYIEEVKYHDIVIGSKAHALSKVDIPKSRRFLSKAFNLLVRIGTGINIKDTQSGLKAGNGDSLRKIFSVMMVKRYAFDVELLSIAAVLKLRIKEMPLDIKLSNRFFYVDEIIRMLLDVASISYRLKIRKWYQKRLGSDPKGV
jgi:glycosyltransferase involved in cell wall biosynthesis